MTQVEIDILYPIRGMNRDRRLSTRLKLRNVDHLAPFLRTKRVAPTVVQIGVRLTFIPVRVKSGIRFRRFAEGTLVVMQLSPMSLDHNLRNIARPVRLPGLGFWGLVET